MEVASGFSKPGDLFNESSTDVFYFPNMCHVCLCFGEKAVNLKRCGACGMISYCGKKHQLQDWPKHKELCKIMCLIKKEWKVDNLFQSLKSIPKDNMAETGLQLFSRLVLKLHELLGRRLQLYEYSMIVLPRICYVCYESNPEHLRSCKRCPQGTFCLEHLDDAYHKNECLKFLSIFYVFSKKDILLSLPIKLKDRSFLGEHKDTDTENFPTSMIQFFETYLSKNIININTFAEDEATRLVCHAYFSEKYSRSLTLIFALKKLLGLRSHSMVIHVIGASLKEMLSDWEIVLHYLPELRELKLVLIGPDLEHVPDAPRIVQKTCVIDKRKLVIETKSTVYEEYYTEDSFLKPDFIACFNAGLYAYPAWNKAVEIFGNVRCPVMITAIMQNEASADGYIIHSKFPSAKCVYFDNNPFASFMYHRMNILEPLAIYNGFLLLFEHLGIKETSD